ncbi:MAG: non-heme iron oxygenase ferredoxin subunit [Betaproteobacteria bacterium]|nr:non-heme iron oxygenase ferredoxin subunit [Betaproteobacteria bacterium]MBA3775167.1 non-heme iron oxygenase ferredoxin subunit [Betaproteobacteria bacterium]
MDTWIEVMAADAIEPDNAVGVVINGRDIAIYNDGGEFFATDNICTHAQAFLCDGFLENGEIECPLHQARFDIRTGKVMREPAIDDIETFPVKVEAGRVFVKIE